MTEPTPSPSPVTSLHRCRDDRLVAGVAGGIAHAFGVDPTLVRLAFALLALVGGAGIPLYLAGWLLIPEDGARTSLAAELLTELGPHRPAAR